MAAEPFGYIDQEISDRRQVDLVQHQDSPSRQNKKCSLCLAKRRRASKVRRLFLLGALRLSVPARAAEWLPDFHAISCVQQQTRERRPVRRLIFLNDCGVTDLSTQGTRPADHQHQPVEAAFDTIWVGFPEE